jgi:hypothetical protein
MARMLIGMAQLLLVSALALAPAAAGGQIAGASPRYGLVVFAKDTKDGQRSKKSKQSKHPKLPKGNKYDTELRKDPGTQMSTRPQGSQEKSGSSSEDAGSRRESGPSGGSRHGGPATVRFRNECRERGIITVRYKPGSAEELKRELALSSGSSRSLGAYTVSKRHPYAQIPGRRFAVQLDGCGRDRSRGLRLITP